MSFSILKKVINKYFLRNEYISLYLFNLSFLSPGKFCSLLVCLFVSYNHYAYFGIFTLGVSYLLMLWRRSFTLFFSFYFLTSYCYAIRLQRYSDTVYNQSALLFNPACLIVSLCFPASWDIANSCSLAHLVIGT